MTNIKPVTRRDMRSLVFHLIYAMDRFDYSVELIEIVENFRTGYGVPIDEDSDAFHMADGIISMRSELDDMVIPLLKNWKLERLGCATRLILRMALWELKQDGAVPSIVMNEAIELAKAFAEKDAYKFINGILDEACRVYKLGIEDKISEDKEVFEDEDISKVIDASEDKESE